MSFPRYPAYKPSGVEWLGEVPGHWRVKRLKHVASAFPSNVDKKAVEGEVPVLLCNYTNVYYNDHIVAGMDFMAATATNEQVGRFTLRQGDVIITKDSETADDIAIAAYVPEDLPGVVCGYHLTMIRAANASSGPFLKWLFGSRYLRARFEVAANGLTRVGLGQYAVDNVDLPIPPIAEQNAIAAFLDRETARIDALVAEQERLIELLREKRQAVISHAVTKGLDPTVPMKDSGVEWLGEVPAHWEVKRVRRALVVSNHLRTPIDLETRSEIVGEYPYYGPTGVLSQIDRFVVDGTYFLVGEDGDHFLKFAWQPMSILVHGQFNVNNHAHLLQGRGTCSTAWGALCFESKDLSPWLIKQGVGRYKLRQERLLDIAIAIPPAPEQQAITAHTDRMKVQIGALLQDAHRAIALLQERRAALISAAVTGQIDVRGLAQEATA